MNLSDFYKKLIDAATLPNALFLIAIALWLIVFKLHENKQPKRR